MYSQNITITVHRRGPAKVLRIGTLQGFWGSGYFNEDSERAPPNLLKAVESKKLLSTAGKLKLLSGADKAGLNLAKVVELPGVMCSAAGGSRTCVAAQLLHRAVHVTYRSHRAWQATTCSHAMSTVAS